jgi:hypothetical protein
MDGANAFSAIRVQSHWLIHRQMPCYLSSGRLKHFGLWLKHIFLALVGRNVNFDR